MISTTHAQENAPSVFESLQDDLQKYVQIATDTKENADYMPYVISTLRHKELMDLGVSSLKEAILLLPGVDISVGMAGGQNPVFRGSNPFAMGQSKLLIDGVVVNDRLLGSYNQFLETPIEIIERIEVVRGPGSLESSVNAYAGSINVITKANEDDGAKKENSLFSSFGSQNYAMGGFVGSYVNDDLKLSSDFFYQKHDKTLPIGVDRFGTPGTDSPLWLKNYALGLNATYKDFYVKGRFAKNESGVSYGQAFSISQDDSDFLNLANNFLETGYVFKITPTVEAKLSVGYLDERRTLQNKVVPNMMALPMGRYFLVDYSEEVFNERLEVKITSIQNHTITVGTILTQAKVKDNIAQSSLDNLATLKTTDLLSNDKRDAQSFYINDLINISEQTSLQIGLKFDHYSDVKDQLSPRLALVHRYDDENIFKLTYTKSFREPSWREEYLVGTAYPNSGSNLEPESVDAYEAAYIFKFLKKSDLKINLFYLQNKNQINAENSSITFGNIDDNQLYGAEVELGAQLSDNDKLYANYSYVAGNNSDNALANAAQDMAKAYYIRTFNQSFSVSSIVKYIGEKERVEGDDRKKTDAYVLTDLTATYKYKPSDVLVSLSVKNLFDESNYRPSPNNTYEGDFAQEGRSFLVRLSKRF